MSLGTMLAYAGLILLAFGLGAMLADVLERRARDHEGDA